MSSKDDSSDRSLLDVLSNKGAATIAIFNRGEYYTVYGQDAVFVAQNVFRSEVCLKSFRMNTADAPLMNYVTMNKGQFEKVVKEAIMLLRYRVHVFGNEGGEWKIKLKGTLGNAGPFEDIIGGSASAANLVIYLHPTIEDNRFTLCAWDSGLFRIILAKFDDTANFSQLMQFVNCVEPAEFLILKPETAPPELQTRERKISTLLKKMKFHEIKHSQKSDWNDVCAVVRKEYKEVLNEVSQEMKDCLSTICSYMKADEDVYLREKFGITDYGGVSVMQVDASAVHALEIFKLSYGYEDTSTTCTLYDVFNKCKSVTGKKLLREWLARPICDIVRLTERQDVIESLVNEGSVRKELHERILARMPDCAQLARKLGARASLQDVYRCHQMYIVLQQLDHTVDDLFEMNEHFKKAINGLMLEPIRHANETLENLSKLAKETIDFEHYDHNKEFRIRPTIDSNLEEISEKMSVLEQKCEKLRAKTASKFDVDVKKDRSHNYGFYFRVTLKDEKNIRKNKDITVLEATKGKGLLFKTDDLEDINYKYNELYNIYAKAQKALEEAVLEEARKYVPTISELADSIAVIDVLVSLSVVACASSNQYVRPKLLPMGSGILHLKQCRHPIIESTSEIQFIPNDVVLDKNRLVVLTGANMGGKSTYLRSAAICVLLAQIGSYVPADDATISIVDGIFTRVGAADQQSRGISTFKAEMLDCASILQRATCNSLVIVDELGRGTSTFDGFGIAFAIAEEILNRVRCFCLYATHFHEMSKLAEQEGAVAMQMSVQADNGVINMLYEVREGVAKSSFGLQVARAVRIDNKVIEHAERILAGLENEAAMEYVQKLKNTSGEELRQLILS